MKRLICSPQEFDLCGKLRKTPVGQAMRELNDFLHIKWAEGGIVFAGLFAIAGPAALGAFIAIFSAVGFVNKAFVELCDCPKHG